MCVQFTNLCDFGDIELRSSARRLYARVPVIWAMPGQSRGLAGRRSRIHANLDTFERCQQKHAVVYHAADQLSMHSDFLEGVIMT